MKLNKKIISLLMISLLSCSLMTGCKSTIDTDESIKIEVTQQRYNEIYQEIKNNLPYDCMKVGTYEDITWLIPVYYDYDPYEIESIDSVSEDKIERKRVIEEMIEYNNKLNEKYNLEGVEISVIIRYNNENYMIDGEFTDYDEFLNAL